MAVYFCNAEPIDLNAIALMGVSVKTGDSPIGFFGTGLKFAIATLLRTGHQIVLHRDGEEIVFTITSETIRGETFDRVTMGDEKLGFTTKLGRTWEPWQAYRELASNARDENGVVTHEKPVEKFGTVFVVTGEAIDACHRGRRDIFLDSHPVSATWSCEIHSGASPHAFYRGVRAYQHRGPALFTYNVLGQMDLTEDRIFKHGYMLEFYAEQAVAACNDEDVVERALLAADGTFEHGFDYSGANGRPSDAFMAVARRLRSNMHANTAAIKLWMKHAGSTADFDVVETDTYEEDLIDQALVLCAKVGADIERSDFLVVRGLGESIFGAVRGSQILIAHAAFDHGHRFVASTLYEEWLHKTESLKDETRALQNLLFEKLFATVERLVALERHNN